MATVETPRRAKEYALLVRVMGATLPQERLAAFIPTG
jgi:hypothetical protein